MGASRERKAANEAVFREVNERIEEMQHEFVRATDEPLHLVCECDRLSCTEDIEMSLDAYERLRSDPACFVVVPTHEDTTVEEVVVSGAGYVVVRKRSGIPRDLAEATDPRR
jgi:hypothetical protein